MELVSFNFMDDNDNNSYKNNYYDAIPVIIVFQFLMIIILSLFIVIISMIITLKNLLKIIIYK